MPGPVRGVRAEEPNAVIPHVRVSEGRGRCCYGRPYTGTQPETADTAKGTPTAATGPLLLGNIAPTILRKEIEEQRWWARVESTGEWPVSCGRPDLRQCQDWLCCGQ
jgi:hypothetical protein